MPSPKNPTDPDFGRFDFRAKVKGFPVWKGVTKEGERDPANTDPNEVQEGINIRPVLDGYKSRGGLTKAASNSATSDLDGIWEASDVGAAVSVGAGDIAGRTYTGYLIGTPWWAGTTKQRLSVDPGQTPVGLPVEGANYHYANALFNSSRLYLIKRSDSEPTRVSEFKQFVGFTAETLIWSTPTPLDQADGFHAICVSGTKLYIGGLHINADLTQSYRIWIWDGTGTPTVDHDFAVGSAGSLTVTTNQLLFIFPFNSGIVVSYQDTFAVGQWIHWYRTAGGVWSSIDLATPAADITTFEPYGGAEDTGGGKLYVTGVVSGPAVAPNTKAVIKSFSGGAAYSNTTIYVGSSIIAPRNVPTLGAAIFDGYVYYGVRDNARTALGRLNIGTGVNTEVFLYWDTYDPPILMPTGGIIPSIWVDGGNLYVLLAGSWDDGVNLHQLRIVLHSAGTNTLSWTQDYFEEVAPAVSAITTKQEPVLAISTINRS